MIALTWPRTTAERLRTTPADLLLALGVTVLSLGDIHAGTTAAPLVARLLAVPILLSLVWRRRWPGAVVVAVCLLQLYLSVNAVGEFPPQLVFLAVLLAIYSAAAHTAGRRSLVAGAASLLLVFLAHVVTGDGDPGDFLPPLVWGAPWLAGRMVRRQTLAAAASATEAAEVRRRREEELREARVRERDRIARELHDVVAHSVSLIVVQAGAERLRLGSEAARTREVLDAVESTGRQALGDLRVMLGLLRDAGDDDEALAPQPQLADLPALVERVRAAGLPVDLELPRLDALPPALGLSAYRIVQEALTNVLKHAGDVPTTVSVRAVDGTLQLDVTSALPVDIPEQRAPGSGRGLLGMRERVALHGGRVSCGPRDGQWSVHAELPLDAA